MTRRVVVTGGAGFIGSHVVDRLVAFDDCEVVVVDDFSTGRESNLAQHRGEPRVFVERADIRNPVTMRRVLRGADTVLHLAVQCLRLSLFDPMFVHQVNATGTLGLCMLAHEERVRRFVYVSSSEVYGSALTAPMSEDHPLRPCTPYAASKLAGEMYALSFASTHRLPVIVVRPFNSYGPREHHEGASGEVIPRFVISAMCGTQPTVFGDGEQTRDFTWVIDTAEGIVRAAASDALVGHAVNIARGQEVSIRDIAQIVLRAVGREELGIRYAPERPGDVRRHFADIGRAVATLGFRPTLSIEEGVRLYVAWLRSQPVEPRVLLGQQDPMNWLPQVTDMAAAS
jgi:UDP-glucose 4-epimerase